MDTETVTDQFDDLYVVSDLHLGGQDEFQVFEQGSLLKATIDKLYTHTEAGRRIGLVLNGDIVDFLAEANPKYLDTFGAVAKLKRIFQDPAFKPVWGALQRFIAKADNQLILVLGNHDLELALPEVKLTLINHLSKGKVAAKGRIHFSFDGTGYRCQINSRNILCMHGNEADVWNLVDYSALQEVRKSLVRGQAPPEWDANAGTRLVLDVMNKIKRDYPIADLLKPEREAILPILAHLVKTKELASQLAQLSKIGMVKQRDGWRHWFGFLAAQDEIKVNATLPSSEEVFSDLIGESTRNLNTEASRKLLIKAFRESENEQAETLYLKEGGGGEYLGLEFWDRLLGKSDEQRAEELRIKLQKQLLGDKTFDIDGPDENFDELDKLAGSDIDFLIAGHTHLYRAHQRKENHGYYYNTGTWATLIQLTTALLNDKAAFFDVYKVFKSGDRSALKKCKIPTGNGKAASLLLHQPTLARIQYNSTGHVVSELCRATARGELVPITKSKYSF
ncbi:MAG: metallophosphoesterase [Sedimenticola sp.]